jgi:hypothetical protein
VLRGQHVAVKRLKPELFANEADLKSFVTEGVTIAKLSHPCAPGLDGDMALVPVFDSKMHSGPRERVTIYCLRPMPAMAELSMRSRCLKHGMCGVHAPAAR